MSLCCHLALRSGGGESQLTVASRQFAERNLSAALLPDDCPLSTADCLLHPPSAATASDSSTGLVSHRYLARAEPPALILTLLAAEQRQHIAWGATSRATASVRETPGKREQPRELDLRLFGGLAAKQTQVEGGIACEPGAAACSLKARKPGPRLYAATAPQLSHAIVKIGYRVRLSDRVGITQVFGDSRTSRVDSHALSCGAASAYSLGCNEPSDSECS